MFIYQSKKCEDCGPLPQNHVVNYINSLISYTLPKFSNTFTARIENIVESILIKLRIIKRVPYEYSPLISSRSTVFIEEAKKRGIKFFTVWGPAGPTGRFTLEKDNKTFVFEGLPSAEFLEDQRTAKIDNKAHVKNILLKEKIPTPIGKCFNVWQITQAIKFGEKLGFPLVVKPCSGSIGRHVFVNIKSKEDLQKAVRSAFSYEPCVIVEKFLENSKTYRATVVDFNNIAVVERRPAHVVGDGFYTIEELIMIKN
jgi:hypothetical protein